MIPVASNVYIIIGDAKDAKSKEFINKNNIGFIINCVPDIVSSIHEKDHVSYFEIKGLYDRANANISQYFLSVVQFINESVVHGKNIFVHCTSGVSRSVTLVIAYLMYQNKMSLREALTLVRNSRPCAEPNIGFWKQLIALEQELNICTEPSYPFVDYVFDTFKEVWFPVSFTSEQESIARGFITEMMNKYSNLFELENVLFDHQF
jgi:protein-tyrosine phosphatase